MTQGVVESLRKDRTGLKVAGKWYGGEAQLNVNQGDTVELELDQSIPDKFGNPSLVNVTILKKAQNPFKGGGNGGTTPPLRSKNYEARTHQMPQDPETQKRITRSHALTTAVAILGNGGDLEEYIRLANRIAQYTVDGALQARAKPPVSKRETSEEFDIDL